MPTFRTHSLRMALAITATLAGVAVAAPLARTPYLQSVTPTSALVAFRTDTNCAPRVRYGTGDALSQEATPSATGRIHAVMLTGLKPGTEYSYAIEACGAATQPVRFTTATTPGTPSLHFTAFGDFGNGGDGEVALGRAMLSHKPELVLGLGDGAYESGTEEEHQQHLFTPLAPLLAQVPMFSTIGNHEYVTSQGQPYLDNFYLPSNNPANTELYYSFDWGPVHFVALDTNCILGLTFTQGRCSAKEQVAWLQQDLAATRQPWKLVFMHHPPWSSGGHGSLVNVRAMLSPIFEARGVDLVLTGHDHDYERSLPMKGNAPAPDGITYLVVGTGSISPFPSAQPAWSAVRTNKSLGYLDVNIAGGTLAAQLLTPTGVALDSFKLTKTLPPSTGQGDSGSTPEPTPAPEPAPTPAPDTPPAPGPVTDTNPEAPPSSPVITPLEPDMGPRPRGGCASAGAGGLLAWAAPLFWVLTRRRREP